MIVSVIIPVYNGEKWLDETLESVSKQTYLGDLQLSIYNDGSTDGTSEILTKWKQTLRARNIEVVLNNCDSNSTTGPRGVGFAKNKAVLQSNGDYLCFLDADDVMHPNRIEKQLAAAQTKPNTLIGCKLHRLPEGSTERFINWANNISIEQLYTQIYTSHGPTILMPTWFCCRSVFDQVGGFNEAGKGTPEDLIFFYQHLRLGGQVYRVDDDLLMYRYHPEATTFSIKEQTIWDIRIEEFSYNVLSKWDKFTIWNAGKQGRKFYRSLTKALQNKEMPKPKIPIIHFTTATKPFVICMKQDLMKGGFEQNLASLNLMEGTDFFFFS